MSLRPSRHRAAAIALAALALCSITAAALAVMLAVGPVMASASTPGSTQPGVSLRGNVNGHGFADLSVAVGKENLVAMHNELIGSEPADGAQLNAGPARITLIFNLPAERGFSTIIVTGPDGNQWQAGPATEDGATVSAPVHPLRPAGEYTIAWRIISADGHPLSDTLRFTLIAPRPATAATPPPNTDRSGSATPATETATDTDTSAASTPVWPWLAGAGALLVIGVVVVTLRASRSRR